MPDMTPVGNTVNYNPQQGIQNLSGMLGIAQGAQQLQTGKYIQQEAQAAAQQQQEMMRERQVIQKAQATGKDDQGNSLIGPDGQPDTVAFSKFVSRAAPLIGQPILQNIIKSQSDQVNLNDAVRGLEGNYRSDLSGIVASGKGAANLDDTITQLQNYYQQNGGEKNAQLTKVVTPLLSQMKDLNTPNLPDQHQDNGVQRLQLALQPASTTAAATAPSYTWRQGPGKPGEMVQTQDNPLAGQTGQVPGSHFTTALGLTETPEYHARVNLATGGAQIDVDRQAQVSGAAQGAATTIMLTQEGDRLADMIQSGKAANWLAEKKIDFGSNSPESVARVELGKILAQIQNNNAGTAGAKSVEALQQTAAANPQVPYPTDAIHNAMDLNRGTARQWIERNNNLGDYVKQHGNASGFADSDSTLTQNHDPLAVEYNALTTPEAKSAFLSRQFPKDPNSARAFMARVRGTYHAVPGGQ